MKIENCKAVFDDLFFNRRNCESELLDYKEQFHFKTTREKLELVKDIVSFANSLGGGMILFGVTDDYEWLGLDESSNDINDIQIGECIRKYTGKNVSFTCGEYQDNNGNLFYLITIEPSKDLISFVRDGAYEQASKGLNKPTTRYVFRSGEIYGRVGSSSKPVQDDLFYIEQRQRGIILTNFSEVEVPYFKFVEREEDKRFLLDSLRNPRIQNVQINGIGGVGKTSFVYYICSQILENKIDIGFRIDALIWITGKIDQFKSDGQILTLRETRLDFREMLSTIANVLMLDCSVDTESLVRTINEKLRLYPVLFVFDNMETIVDKRIIDFYQNLPSLSHVLFTSRNNLAVSFTRLDLVGFDQKQFLQYISNCLEEYRPSLKDEYMPELKKYSEQFRKLTGGSPILMSFIMTKICSGHNIASVLKGLQDLVQKQDFYKDVMNFCFNDVFEELPELSKIVLYVMSISDEEKEVFSLTDLAFILNEKDELVDQAAQRIYSCSFCSLKESLYSCPMLIRAFVSKKMNDRGGDLHAIADSYYRWRQMNQAQNESQRAFYNKIKAYDFSRKLAAAKIDEIIQSYSQSHDYERSISALKLVRNDAKDFGYVDFSIAKFIINNSGDSGNPEPFFRSAIEKDPENGFYHAEYGFFLKTRKSRKDEAIAQFQFAIKYGDSSPNVHHGIADAMSKLYNVNGSNAFTAEEILDHFNKGYIDTKHAYDYRYRCALNAHSHAVFLYKLERYQEAFDVCCFGLKYRPDDKKLNRLRGSITKMLGLNAISSLQLSSYKNGIFAGASDDDMRAILDMVSQKGKR